MSKPLILCDCSGSSPLDSEALGQATGMPVQTCATALCTAQLDQAAAALQAGDGLFCCAQEQTRFEALAEE